MDLLRSAICGIGSSCSIPAMADKQPRYTSIFLLFRPAVGPSSSHTLAPLLIGREVRRYLASFKTTRTPPRLQVDLYGSLAATGKGHLTDCAITAGLAGERPEEGGGPPLCEAVGRVSSRGGIEVEGGFFRFDPKRDIHWHKGVPSWSKHPNTLRVTVVSGKKRLSWAYRSTGAGFFERIGAEVEPQKPKAQIPYPYRTMADLMEAAEKTGFPIAQLVLANEAAFHGRDGSQILAELEAVWRLMRASIDRGLSAEGELPGGLGVRRRAKRVWEESSRRIRHHDTFRATVLRADAYALAVAEENAAGGAIVTAPTAGAAGVLPAVLAVWQEDLSLPDRTVARGLLTAGACGVVIKNLASLSGAEVGCQGEIGSAAAMAAAAAAELAGGLPAQVEMAAEIALEHHLGMTCDPVGGLVQIPCIERNAMGAVKALNAAAVSLASEGRHLISFDAAARAMWRTGQDLRTAYRETGRGGLAAANFRNPKLVSR